MLGLEVIAARVVEKKLSAAVDQLLRVENEQTALLRGIDAKLDALLAGPYNAGKRHLESAFRDGMDDTTRQREIDKARDRFIDAHDQLGHDHLLQSHAAVLAAGTSLLLKYPASEAVTWLQRAHCEAATAARQRAADVNKRVKRRTGATSTLATFVEPLTSRKTAASISEFPGRSIRDQSRPTMVALGDYVAAIGDAQRMLAVNELDVLVMRLTETDAMHTGDWRFAFKLREYQAWVLLLPTGQAQVLQAAERAERLCDEGDWFAARKIYLDMVRQYTPEGWRPQSAKPPTSIQSSIMQYAPGAFLTQ